MPTPRKLASLRIANGEYYRPSRHGAKRGPAFPLLDLADVPEFLSEDARAEWERLGPPLVEVGVLTECDRDIFIALCAEWGFYVEALRNIARLGVFPKNAKNRKESEHVNKWCRLRDTSFKAILRLWPLLGLTPVDRSRVSVVEPARPEIVPSVRPRTALDSLGPLPRTEAEKCSE